MTASLPRSLFGRIVLLLGAALAVAQFANFGLILNERQKLSLSQNDGPAITRFASAFADISEADPAFRQALLTDLSHRGARYVIRGDDSIREVSRDAAIEAKLAENLRSLGYGSDLTIRAIEPQLAKPQPNPSHSRTEVDRLGAKSANQSDRYTLTLAARLSDGQWVVGTLPTLGRDPWFVARLVAATLLLYVLVLGATLLMAQRLALPLRDLTLAARQFGGRVAPIAVEPRGPDDLRDAIDAFNAMNRRLYALLDEKDAMLGAIGHDLRTPLASLRIRLEAMEPPDERAAAVRKVVELAITLEDILSLATSGRSRETVRPADIAALIETVVEEFQDMDAPVTWSPASKVVLAVQPNQLKRAVLNLVDNAIKYGGSAAVSLKVLPGFLRIEVADNGPGIAPDKLEHVLRPFYRLEESRNRDTGGSGLGLAIAKAISESHGGRLSLDNADTGLVASITLPLRSD